jgi:nucleoside-diphosphate-sugar epimerase
MIVITGVTSHTGRTVAARLLDKGRPVWVVGRSLGRLRPFVERGAARSWPTRPTARPWSTPSMGELFVHPAHPAAANHTETADEIR